MGAVLRFRSFEEGIRKIGGGSINYSACRCSSVYLQQHMKLSHRYLLVGQGGGEYSSLQIRCGI